MKFLISSTLLALVTAVPVDVSAGSCILPIPASNNITTPFAIKILYPYNPAIHGRRMNFWPAGGGDQHLDLEPAGAAISNLTLVNGVITTSMNDGSVIHAVINGEYTARDNTTKIFTTRRSDPRAVFDVQYACDIDNPTLTQTEIKLTSGDVCVREATGGRYEFRSSPFGNTAAGVVKCFKVKLKLLFE
ncbi:hypothetical protein EV426DRAFT_564803 [Tirmania nivea]|nr:hypothetical protein EV426DRAFT_564803 [Tirmania nivea]